MDCTDKNGGEFEHYRACVLEVIAMHALSNSRRDGWTKRVTGAQRRNIMNA
jgi:hypothetical protein